MLPDKPKSGLTDKVERFGVWPLILYGPLLIACLYGSALVAEAQLGRWPIPSRDDPKFIGGGMPIAYYGTIFVMVFGLPTAIAGAIWSTCSAAIRRSRTFWIRLFEAVGGAGLIALCVSFLRSDPHGVIAWFMD